MFTDLLFTAEDMKKIKFHDEMKCKVYTVYTVISVSKNEEYNPE